MKRKFILICLLASALLSSCASAVKTIEVTRVVPQTVMATQLVTQIVQVEITTTPQPTYTPYPTAILSPTWADSIRPTPYHAITPTPGLQVADSNTRPDVEKFVSKQYIKDYLVMNFGEASQGGKVFCAYQPIGMGNDGHTIKLYLWIVCHEYVVQNGNLSMGTGMSVPVVLYVEARRRYFIVDAKDIEDGLQLRETNLPPAIVSKLQFTAEEQNALVKPLQTEVDQEARDYFRGK
jgi:hypothetical protein